MMGRSDKVGVLVLSSPYIHQAKPVHAHKERASLVFPQHLDFFFFLVHLQILLLRRRNRN